MTDNQYVRIPQLQRRVPVLGFKKFANGTKWVLVDISTDPAQRLPHGVSEETIMQLNPSYRQQEAQPTMTDTNKPHSEPDGTFDAHSVEARYGVRVGEDWLPAARAARKDLFNPAGWRVGDTVIATAQMSANHDKHQLRTIKRGARGVVRSSTTIVTVEWPSGARSPILFREVPGEEKPVVRLPQDKSLQAEADRLRAENERLHAENEALSIIPQPATEAIIVSSTPNVTVTNAGRVVRGTLMVTLKPYGTDGRTLISEAKTRNLFRDVGQSDEQFIVVAQPAADERTFADALKAFRNKEISVDELRDAGDARAQQAVLATCGRAS